jgi:hypothetical protein
MRPACFLAGGLDALGADQCFERPTDLEDKTIGSPERGTRPPFMVAPESRRSAGGRREWQEAAREMAR